MRFWRLLLLLVFVLHTKTLIVTCHAQETKDGGQYFKEAIQLFEKEMYHEAAMNFWPAVLLHNVHKHKDVYTVEQAFNNLLLCFQRQDKLAIGYAFLATELFKRGDVRSLDFLKTAYKLEPDNKEILQVMAVMGETRESLLYGGRRYKKEEEDGNDETSSAHENINAAGSCVTAQQCQAHFVEDSSSKQGPLQGGLLDSGWDENALNMYETTIMDLNEKPRMTVTIPPLRPFLVASDDWWQYVNGQTTWEPETFQIFERYIHTNTTVIDFGTWIGPTLLFHAQLSRKSFGIEADPVAFATVQHNVVLNLDTKEWAKRIHLESVAVSSPQDAGPLTMKSSEAGNSESGVTSPHDGAQQQWTVNGHTLPYIFARWGLSLANDSPIFIKIDIESYECRLIPSFYDWFVSEPSSPLPTIFVSFHPQVEPCTKSQMKQVLEVFKLYKRVSCRDDIEVLPIEKQTTFEEFEQMLDKADCLTQKYNSDFVLSGRKSN